MTESWRGQAAGSGRQRLEDEAQASTVSAVPVTASVARAIRGLRAAPANNAFRALLRGAFGRAAQQN